MEQHVLNISNSSLSHSLTRYIAPADVERVLNTACGTTPRIPLLLSVYHLIPIAHGQVHSSFTTQSFGASSMLNGACGTTPRISLLVSTTLSLPPPPSLPASLSCFSPPGVAFLTAACAATYFACEHLLTPRFYVALSIYPCRN